MIVLVTFVSKEVFTFLLISHDQSDHGFLVGTPVGGVVGVQGQVVSLLSILAVMTLLLLT